MAIPSSVPVVTENSIEWLSARQRIDYEHHREDFLGWLLSEGREPNKYLGYSLATVKNTAYRTDYFYRWVWDREGYTTNIPPTIADEFIADIAGRDYKNSTKAKYLKGLKRLYKWRKIEKGELQWEPEITFQENHSSHQPQDYLTKEERHRVRKAALEYGSIPSYSSLTPKERSRWKSYLAQRFGKPKQEVSLEDWKRANGWKIPSLVWTSLDAGLRPVEVQRASVDWIDTGNGVLRIPSEDSSKNKGNWVVGLTERTSDSLARWLTQREKYDLYSNCDKLWLTREGNPYQSYSLSYLLDRLCEIAEIETKNRKLSWYSLRHSLGTYMTREEDLAATAAQLRHKSSRTTMRYDNAPVEERKQALERIN